ncbi:MAG: hypothetical protein ACK5V3_08335 [Bdellovibrionales bacterium]
MNKPLKIKKKSSSPFIFLLFGLIGFIVFFISFKNSMEFDFPNLLSVISKHFRQILNDNVEHQKINGNDKKKIKSTTEVHANLDRSNELYQLIKNDFKYLKETLDSKAFYASEIIWNTHDKSLNIERLSSSLNIKVSNHEKVSTYLEVDAFSSSSNGKITTVLQLSYFDKTTNNKIFELTRSYEHKKKPD